MVEDCAFSHNSDFTKWLDFAYWWSYSGGGSVINGATLSSSLPYDLSPGHGTLPYDGSRNGSCGCDSMPHDVSGGHNSLSYGCLVMVPCTCWD